ncbi:YciI family protein [Orbaceae bacterium ac157xtp]
MFIAILTYKKPLEEIENNLEQHIQFLDKYYENHKFIASGRRNPRIGGVIIINSNSLSEVEQIINDDPFYKYDLADYELIEFIPTKNIDLLSGIIK